MAKSTEVKFNEALAAITKASLTKQFETKVNPLKETLGLVPIETQLNLAEEVLKTAGVVRAKESTTTTIGESISRLTHEQYQVFTKRLAKNPKMSFDEQMKLANDLFFGIIKETAPTRKHNGTVDNFSESNPLRASEEFTPGYVKETTTNPCAKGDAVLFDGLLKLGKITEAEHRNFTNNNNKPEGYEALNEGQRKEFDFARLVGISESDAFKLAKMAGSNINEVSRR